MRVLVTGGGGFLGRKIIDLCLARGYWVRSFGRSPQPDLQALGVHVFQGDLSDPVAVNNAIFDVDVVFHTAAKAEMWGPWDDFYKTNVIGTRNVLHAVKSNGIEFLIYTSTPSVVYNGQNLENVDESQPYGENFICHYAHTKRIAEEEVLKSGGLALRPHLIYGPGEPHATPRILELAKKNRLKIIGDGKNLVSMTHVDNAANAHMLALDALKNGVGRGEAYFINDTPPLPLWSWVNSVLKSNNLPPLSKSISYKKAYFAAFLLELIYKTLYINSHPNITRFIVKELSHHHHFNINKAIQQLNYQPI